MTKDILDKNKIDTESGPIFKDPTKGKDSKTLDKPSKDKAQPILKDPTKESKTIDGPTVDPNPTVYKNGDKDAPVLDAPSKKEV